MNDKQPVVLGELKKDRSSKPLFAVVMLFFIFAVLYVLPSIKEYMDENNNDFALATAAWINHLLKKNQEVEITKTTFICKNGDQTLSYYFENNKLLTINEKYAFVYNSLDGSDKTTKYNQLVYYENIIKELNCNNCKTEITDDGDISTLSLVSTIDVQGVVLADENQNVSKSKSEYFSKNSTPSEIKNELTRKDYICE